MSPDAYRAARKLRGTQADVATMLGIQRETVVRREAGEVEITREMQLALEALPAKAADLGNTPSREARGSAVGNEAGMRPSRRRAKK